MQVRFHYNAAIVSLNDITMGDGAGSPWDGAQEVYFNDDAGDVTWAIVLPGMGNCTMEDSVIGTLHLTGIAEGTTQVALRPDDPPEVSQFAACLSDEGYLITGFPLEQPIMVDDTDPDVVITSITPDPTSPGMVYITVMASDAHSPLDGEPDVTVTLNGGTAEPATFVGSTPPTYNYTFEVEVGDPSGTATVEASVSDAAGNTASTSAPFVVSGCTVDAECDDGLFCNGTETCEVGVCTSGGEPCTDPCEQCDEETDSCLWCLFDLDQSGVIGGGDFGLFSGCFGHCYLPADGDYDVCRPTNFDQVIDGGSGEYCVGGGDFGVFSGCFALTCGECSTCFGPGSGGGGRSVDDGWASVALVPVRTPTPVDVATTLPASADSVRVGQTFHLEIWASGSRTRNGAEDGLAAVYVDVHYPASHLVVEEIIPSESFGLFAHGGIRRSLDVFDRRPVLLESVGGCAPLGEARLGTSSSWAKVATLKMVVRRPGTVAVETAPSHGAYGISIVNRFGDLDAAQVEFNSAELRLRGAVPRIERRSPKTAK